MFRRCVVLCALWLCGCARESGQPDTVLLLVLDTVRADHLGCYGFASARTPHLDALAARGTLFTDAMTVAPITQPAVTTLLTGQLPLRHGVRDNQGFVLDPSAVTLAEQLRDAGWRTAAVVASAVLDADRGLDQGFEVYDDAFTGPYPVYQRSMRPLAPGLARTARRATEVTDRALALLDRFGSDRLFLLVHYFDAHHPYDPPPEFAALHPDRYYDGEISYLDHELGRLLAAFDPARTLVIVVADHGEGLQDHDEGAHGFFLYQSTLHVPWIVAGPGVPAGLERSDLVSLVDLQPTVAAQLGLDDAPDDRDGRVLRWEASEAEPVAQYAETFRTLITYDWRELRALREGSYKLIEGGERVELYDLATDPHERDDLGETAFARRLRQELHERVGEDDPERVKQLAEEPPDSDRLQVLETLGYLAGSNEVVDPVRRRHPLDAVPDWNRRQRQRYALRQAMVLVEDREFARGVEILDEVLQDEPDNVNALYYRGLAREALGRTEEGWQDLTEAERLDPAFVPLQFELAARELEVEPERAFARLERLRALDPTNAEVARFLARAYRDHEAVERAVETYRDAIRLDPTGVDTYLEIADLLYALGRAEEARPYYDEVLSQRPEHPRSVEIRQRLADAP